MKQYITRRNLVIGLIALVVFCCVGAFATTLLPGADEKENETPVAMVSDEADVIEQDQNTGVQVEVSEDIDETLEPTDTAEPTNTPKPTNTPEPTSTPEPTNTPTPKPTNTPVPTPTNTPEPIILTGSGDSIVSIEKGSEPALVRISGNASGRFFAVSNFDADGNQIDLLVNTTDPYEGVRPLDFRNGEQTAEFEISATGAWTIEVLPLGSIERVNVPGEISGSGDYVFALNGDSPGRATINGNSDSGYFGVFAYGSSVDLLVNTTDPYEGTVRLAGDVLIIEVQGSGDWIISIE